MAQSGSGPPSGRKAAGGPTPRSPADATSEPQTRRMADRFEAGSMLGRYTIEGSIGEGGMGVVYRARDGRLGRKVALKVLLSDEGDPESIERAKRFLREARAAAALDHPNAVSIFDVGEVGETSFIAMELVNGQSLRDFVGAAEPGIEQRLRWLVDIALALGAAHDKRIIHRDIKPENVMVRDDGRVKVLDFGLARRAAEPKTAPEAVDNGIPKIHHDTTFTETGQSTLTAVGTLLGTPQYMAPEQIRSDPVDGRSDQFSWGVVAYEILTGELPWKGVGIHVMARILTDDPVPIRERDPNISAEAAAVIMRALSRSRDDRFPTMDALITALEPHAETASRSDPRSIRHRSLTPRAVPAVRSAPPATTGGHITQRSADDAALRREAGLPPRGASKTSAPPRVAVVEAGPEPLRAKGLAVAVGVIALCLGGAIAVRAARGRAAVDHPPPPPASATAPPSAATALTDLPDPHTSSPEALVAYRAGLAELRFGGVRDAMVRAAALDPSLAAAHLQCAVDAAESDLDDDARAHLRRARDLRAQLTDRDQALLEAIEPVLLRQPASYGEAEIRLAKAVERFPGDAQLWYERGVLSELSVGPEESLPFVEHAVALDPKYGLAMSVMGQDLAYLGRFADARRVLSNCMAIAPTYVTCAQDLAHVLDQEGACEEEETMARTLAAASAAEGVAQLLLARALAAQGKPEAAVREALKMRWSALPAAERRRVEPEETLSLALYTGDFVGAERLAHDLEAATEQSRRESDHGAVARRLAEIALETGKTPDAGRVAEAFLGRRDAWDPDVRTEDYALAADAVPELLAVARRAGKLSRAELGERRAEWVRRWVTRASPFYQRYLWMHAYAETVETDVDAKEALLALPPGPLPPFTPRTLAEADVGHTYLLAGRTDDALSWLTRATRSCRVLDHPVAHTRAQLWLGLAREAAHDREGACSAYRVVLSRWGKAKPRSVTADKAAERSKALSCAM
jgi:eukaryotic-like serine/threonine-protein kinase